LAFAKISDFFLAIWHGHEKLPVPPLESMGSSPVPLELRKDGFTVRKLFAPLLSIALIFGIGLTLTGVSGCKGNNTANKAKTDDTGKTGKTGKGGD
jgi:hypothetical protein